MSSFAKTMYSERLEQIEKDLKKQYRRGKNRDNRIIASLLNEKEKINSILNR